MAISTSHAPEGRGLLYAEGAKHVMKAEQYLDSAIAVNGAFAAAHATLALYYQREADRLV